MSITRTNLFAVLLSLLLSVIFAQPTHSTCTDWSYTPYTRNANSALNSWDALIIGPTITLGTGGIDTGYSRTPYLSAFENPGSYPNSSPTTLYEASRIIIPTFSENIALNGNYAYLSTSTAGLVIVNVTDPYDMVIDHTMPLTGTCRDLVFDADRELLFSAEWDAVRIYSTATPSNPVLIATEPASQASALVQNGNMIYVACASLGLRVIDTTTPQSPFQIAHLPVGGSVRDIALIGDRALLVGPTVGLVSVNINNPGSPQYLNTVSCEGEPEQVLTKNGYIYIIARNLRHPDYGFLYDKMHLYRNLESDPPYYEVSYFDHDDPGVMTIAGDVLLFAVRYITMASVQCAQVSSVPDVPQVTFELSQPWPNPFNPAAEFSFKLPNAHTGRLSVYDLRGRQVRSLWQGVGNGQPQPMRWNGLGDDGLAAPSGTYLFLLRDDQSGQVTTRRGSLVK